MNARAIFICCSTSTNLNDYRYMRFTGYTVAAVLAAQSMSPAIL